MISVEDQIQTSSLPMGWVGEVVNRNSKRVLVITHDQQIRGSISLYNDTEVEKWIKLIIALNS